MQRTLSKRMGPVPCPKPARVTATAPTYNYSEGLQYFSLATLAYFIASGYLYFILYNYTAVSWRIYSVLTSGGESQLSAHNNGTWCTPSIITHCAPNIIVAVLHTTLSSIPTIHKSDITSGAYCIGKKGCVGSQGTPIRENAIHCGVSLLKQVPIRT